MTGSVEPPTLLLCHSFPYLFFFCGSFLTCLSSPPSFSVRSDCPEFLTFQLRMLEIPSSCCGLAQSLLLFHPSILHPSPLHLLIYIWPALDKGGRGFAVHLHLHFAFFFLFFGTSYPPFLLLLPSVLSLSEGVRHSHMTASVEGLETGFYTWGNSVKRDNTQSNTQKTELIWDCGRAFSATAGRIRKRKDMVELNGQDVWAGEK